MGFEISLFLHFLADQWPYSSNGRALELILRLSSVVVRLSRIYCG